MSMVTIWLHELEALVPRALVEERFRCLAANEAVPRVELDLVPLDKHGHAITPPVRVRFPNPELREHAAGGGTMAAEAVQPPLGVKLGKKFHTLKVRNAAGERIFDREEVLDDRPESRKSVRLVAGGTGWVLTLVAELYDNWDDFHAACREFIEYVLKTPPFSDADIKPLIGFELLYAPAGPKGLFGTREAIRLVQEKNRNKPEAEQDRRIFGSAKSVMDFLKTMRWRGKRAGGHMILVVVNSTARGGAGGAGNGTPTWTTITGGAHEDWKDVALHELGHAFGLADEYFAAKGVGGEPPKLEPNVSRHADPARAPWARFWPDRTGKPWFQPSASQPTLGTEGAGLDLFAGRQRFADGVGTFQGARYDATRFFRPAFDCRMHHTDVDFCHCCREVIRETIKAAAGKP